jgi:hydrogenase nickel incorporation protein HypA/HybF
MHELSLAGAVIDTAERHAAGRRVLLIQLRLGELRQVVPDSLAFYFEHVARGTLCEGATLEYETVPATLGCSECGSTWPLTATLGSGSATWGQAPPGGA